MLTITESLETAVRCHTAGDLPQAEKLYRDVLRIDDRHEGALFKLGNLYLARERWAESRACYESGLQINDAHVPAWNNLGNVLDSLGEFAAAVIAYRRALELRSDIPQIHNNLGTVLKNQGKIDEAIACYRFAIGLNADYADAHSNLGVALNEFGQADEAIECYRRALQINPQFAETRNNLGITMMTLGRLDEAVDQFQQALQLNPSFAEAHNNLGNAFKEQGQVERAIKCYGRALTANPNYADAHHNRARTLLLSGDYERGWDEYEWRWWCGGLKPREFAAPAWDGSSLDDKTVLVYAEQGVGDEIVFSSCLSEIIEQSAQCLIECDRRLIPLFERSFPQARMFARPIDAALQSGEVPPFDFQVAMGSLPRFFRRSPESFPRQHSFLIPDEAKCRKWQQRLARLGDGLKVGISWRGGLRPGAVRKKSTQLKQWANVFNVPGVDFINLQYGDCSKELAEAERQLGVRIIDWDDSDPLKDLDDFAAEVSALDLVISVSNTTVHTAGALGVPVWTMLNFAPEWRWLLNRNDTPWYKNMRLFRQPQRGNWDSVFQSVTECLQEKVRQYKAI